MDDAVSRFWDKYILKTTPYNVPERARRWLVRHAEVFIKAHPGVVSLRLLRTIWNAISKRKAEVKNWHITRPAISEKRLSLTSQGKVRYELKTPYRDGTTHVIFEPVDFTAPAHPCARGISASLHVIAKLAALVPKPRVNLTRFHGVFAPNSKHRAWVTPAKRGKGSQKVADEQEEKTPAQRHVAMTWAHQK